MLSLLQILGVTGITVFFILSLGLTRVARVLVAVARVAVKTMFGSLWKSNPKTPVKDDKQVPTKVGGGDDGSSVLGSSPVKKSGGKGGRMSKAEKLKVFVEDYDNEKKIF